MAFHKATWLLALYASILHPAVANNAPGFNNTASVASSSDTAAAAATNIIANANAANNGNGNNGNSGNNGGASASTNGGGSLTLSANAVQTGSQSNGLANATAGQAASDTDNANFINFCAGKQLTNGKQITSGSCNGIVMGDIPATSNMISTIITNPGPGSSIPANQDFTVTVQVANLVAGSFTNPDSTYYAAPQALKGGKVVGHTHITIQSLGNNIATATPPDAGTFAFFKGINDAGNGSGALSAAVAGGLPAGVYRVCTMTSASNHQPVTMPVAQRGAQDDCNKFTVTNGGGNGGNGNGNNNGNSSTNANTGKGNGNGNANSNSNTSSAANGNSKGGSNTSTAARTASSATSSANTASSSAAGGNQNGGGGRSRGGGKRFVLREFVA